MAVAFMVVTGYSSCGAVVLVDTYFSQHILIFMFDICKTNGYSMRKLLV